MFDHEAARVPLRRLLPDMAIDVRLLELQPEGRSPVSFELLREIERRLEETSPGIVPEMLPRMEKELSFGRVVRNEGMVPFKPGPKEREVKLRAPAKLSGIVPLT